jgi:hypothetical protein
MCVCVSLYIMTMVRQYRCRLCIGFMNVCLYAYQYQRMYVPFVDYMCLVPSAQSELPAELSGPSLANQNKLTVTRLEHHVHGRDQMIGMTQINDDLQPPTCPNSVRVPLGQWPS